MNAGQTRPMVLMFTDVVGSVDMKTRLGEATYASALRRHDALFREIAAQMGAEILKDLGDGFFVRFETADQAVRAGLAFQHALSIADWESEPVRVRVGLHLGDVTELAETDEGRGKLVGLTADVTARVMGLALPGQILMSEEVFDAARGDVRKHPDVDGNRPELRWMAHGPYLFQGAERPLEVFEVGANGVAPLRAPPDGEKARRAVPAGEEELYGWRPAAGLPIPGRLAYVLDRQLGEGGFGEVWLARHQDDGDALVFKFCFDAERVRGLRRELAIFRYVQEALGDREDIARIREIRIDRPPFWLESEFTEEGDLTDWAAAQGGIDEVPLPERLRLAREVAEAVAAAHSVGILHKDIKPSNVLIWKDEDGVPHARLADFGIGTLLDPSKLTQHDITVVGFTEGLDSSSGSTLTGTRLYAAPETLAGQPYTTRSDVYALGIVLYQLVVGDLRRPLAQGWEGDVDDPVLREDIASCVAGRPGVRLEGAGLLGERLQRLEMRRLERAQKAADEALATKRRRRNRVLMVGASVLVILLGVAALLLMEEKRLRDEADQARIEADDERARAVAARQTAEAVSGFLNDDLLGALDPREARGRTVTVREVLDSAAARVEGRFDDQPEVEAALRRTIGRVYLGIGQLEQARPHLERALAVYREVDTDDRLDVAKTLEHIALLESLDSDGDSARAVTLAKEVVAIREKALGRDNALTLRALADVGMYQALAQGELAAGIDNPMVLTMLASVRGLGETQQEMRAELIRLIYEVERFQRAGDQEGLLAFAEKEAKPFLENPAFAERVPWAWSSFALSLYQDERPDAAIGIANCAVGIGEKHFTEGHPQVLHAIETRAKILKLTGSLEASEAGLARAARLRAKINGANHHMTLATREERAWVLLALERYETAETEALDIYERWKTNYGADVVGALDVAGLLVTLYTTTDRPEDAKTWRTRAGG